MGCAQSASDPNVMYGTGHDNITQFSSSKNSKEKKNNKIHPVGNGTSIANGKSKLSGKTLLKGDISTYREAKFHREKKLRDDLLKREQLAKDMSDRVMEEKERLSLTSGRSRATSRATSPKSGRCLKAQAGKETKVHSGLNDTTRTLRDVSMMSMPSSSSDVEQDLHVCFSQDLDRSGQSESMGISRSEERSESERNGISKSGERSETERNGISRLGEGSESARELLHEDVANGNAGLRSSVIEEESCDESLVLESGMTEDRPDR